MLHQCKMMVVETTKPLTGYKFYSPRNALKLTCGNVEVHFYRTPAYRGREMDGMGEEGECGGASAMSKTFRGLCFKTWV